MAKAAPSPDIFQRVLDDLIEQQLMQQAADAAHITVRDTELDGHDNRVVFGEAA